MKNIKVEVDLNVRVVKKQKTVYHYPPPPIRRHLSRKIHGRPMYHAIEVPGAMPVCSCLNTSNGFTRIDTPFGELWVHGGCGWPRQGALDRLVEDYYLVRSAELART